MSGRKRFGATGDYPDAKLNEYDEGGLEFGIANDGKLVHVKFGTPVKWFALPPDSARELAILLLRHAGQVDGLMTGVTIGDRSAKL